MEDCNSLLSILYTEVSILSTLSKWETIYFLTAKDSFYSFISVYSIFFLC